LFIFKHESSGMHKFKLILILLLSIAYIAMFFTPKKGKSILARVWYIIACVAFLVTPLFLFFRPEVTVLTLGIAVFTFLTGWLTHKPNTIFKKLIAVVLRIFGYSVFLVLVAFSLLKKITIRDLEGIFQYVIGFIISIIAIYVASSIFPLSRSGKRWIVISFTSTICLLIFWSTDPTFNIKYDYYGKELEYPELIFKTRFYNAMNPSNYGITQNYIPITNKQLSTNSYLLGLSYEYIEHKILRHRKSSNI